MALPPLIKQFDLALQTPDLPRLLILRLLRLERKPRPVEDLVAEERQREGFEQRPSVRAVEVHVCFGVGAVHGVDLTAEGSGVEGAWELTKSRGS